MGKNLIEELLEEYLVPVSNRLGKMGTKIDKMIIEVDRRINRLNVLPTSSSSVAADDEDEDQ